MGEPWRRNQAEKTGQDEAAARSNRRVSLCSVTPSPAGAFEPQGGKAESKQRHHAAQNHGDPCGLQIARQRQHRVLHGAAEDTRAVPHTVHPQTLHLWDGGHDTGPGIDAHLPVGQQSGHSRSKDAQERQGKRQDLNGGREHGSDPPVQLPSLLAQQRPGRVLTADNSSAQAPVSCDQGRNENWSERGSVTDTQLRLLMQMHFLSQFSDFCFRGAGMCQLADCLR